uniref:Uncharacterized protein n=1 Tax=Brassica campestris TaxID=3711 RepID=A0A3P6BT32_BRACM|nr:unnamed protein product [Brassica rapa]
MVREEAESRGDDTMIDAPLITNPKPEDFFNVHYLRIYYGKFAMIFFKIYWCSQVMLI